MNKRVIIILLFIFISLCLSENNRSAIHAEYCLAYDSTNICAFWTSKWQLKISQIIADVEFPKLNREREICHWSSTNTYAYVEGERIALGSSLASCMDCDIKSSLRYEFSFINPWQCYSVAEERQFEKLKSLPNNVIPIEWEKIGFCKDKKDTIRGQFNIKVKGMCNTEDLEWNAKYDIREIFNPIDTMNFRWTFDLWNMDTITSAQLLSSDSLYEISILELDKLPMNDKKDFLPKAESWGCSLLGIPESLFLSFSRKETQMLYNSYHGKYFYVSDSIFSSGCYPGTPCDYSVCAADTVILEYPFLVMEKHFKRKTTCVTPEIADACALHFSSKTDANGEPIILINDTAYRIVKRKDGSSVLRKMD